MLPSFLHERCKAHMCEDCISLAEEYQEIEVRRRAEMIALDEENERLKGQFVDLKRKADMWEQIARAGLPDIIEAWADCNGTGGRWERVRELVGEEVTE